MLRQHKYILDILTRAGMTSCKIVDTLVSPSKLALQSDHPFSAPTRFHQIVGGLQYLTFTRPDICFAVKKVCQYMHAPTLMIASLRVAILFSLVKHRFHGNPASNVQLLAPPLRLSIKP